MSEKNKKSKHDPKVILQTAIEELDLFTQYEASRLEIGDNGRLVASKESPLKKIVGLARSLIGPIFSEHKRKKQAKKLEELKQAILNARDIIQSHSALIIKFKEGDDAQRKLADYALAAIQRYNTVVSEQNQSSTANYDVYNYERQRLLSDQEIKGQPIELPHTLAVKFDSHPDAHPAHKMFKEMRQRAFFNTVKKTPISVSPTHKKTLQFMIDTFHMKAIRMMQTHLSPQNSLAEIVAMVKETPLEIDDESNADVIAMQQLLEVCPGFFIFVSGCFKRNSSDPKFLTLPILDSFRLSFQLSHSGYPYPSQHTGWALADKWVEAYPLRADQVPLFQKIDQRRKRLSQQLIHDQTIIQKVRRRAKLKREVFDQNRYLFLPLCRQLHQSISNAANGEEQIIEAFFKELEQASSPFDLLVHVQQKIQNVFVLQPIKALEDEWLESETTLLRIGSPPEKFHAACERLHYYRQIEQENLNSSEPHYAFLNQQGGVLGQAFQTIGLQYQSEKMGFSPPLLSDFERKLQLCAFQQLLSFIEECENKLDINEPDLIKQQLLEGWTKELEVLYSSSIEEKQSLSLAIIEELENYFNSRFYLHQPRLSEKVGS